jgi:hypothetical protein
LERSETGGTLSVRLQHAGVEMGARAGFIVGADGNRSSVVRSRLPRIPALLLCNSRSNVFALFFANDLCR